MFTLIVTLHVLVSIFLIIVVLLQAGKGASIGAAFGGASSQTLFGSSGPAPFLTKITAGCAVIFMITSITLTYMSAHRFKSSIMKDAPAVTQQPQTQTTTPQQETKP